MKIDDISKNNSMCWICGGWKAVKITIKPKRKEIIKSVKNCLSLDNYIPFNMEFDKSKQQYFIDRMLPPGKSTFMFIKEENGMYSKPIINENDETEYSSKYVSILFFNNEIAIPNIGKVELNVVNVIVTETRYNVSAESL